MKKESKFHFLLNKEEQRQLQGYNYVDVLVTFKIKHEYSEEVKHAMAKLAQETRKE